MAAYPISEYLLDIGTILKLPVRSTVGGRGSYTVSHPRITNRDRECLPGVVFDFDGVIVDSHPCSYAGPGKLSCSPKAKRPPTAELGFVREGAKREEILAAFSRRTHPQSKSRGMGAEKGQILSGRRERIENLRRVFVEFLFAH